MFGYFLGGIFGKKPQTLMISLYSTAELYNSDIIMKLLYDSDIIMKFNKPQASLISLSPVNFPVIMKVRKSLLCPSFLRIIMYGKSNSVDIKIIKQFSGDGK